MLTKEGRLVQLPVKLEPHPNGGFTVTSPVLPELVTEGDTVSEAIANVEDAFRAVAERYEDSDRQLPADLFVDTPGEPLSLEVVATP